MGLFSRIFGSDKDETPVIAIDLAEKKRELDELSSALRALTDRMRGDEFPVDNPGWQGRIDDLARARKEADQLASQPDFTRQDLYDFGTTVRPLYRGNPPTEYAALSSENDRVVRALDALLD